jgi:hypothetical protein
VGYGNSVEEPTAFLFRGLSRVNDGFFAKLSYPFRLWRIDKNSSETLACSSTYQRSNDFSNVLFQIRAHPRRGREPMNSDMASVSGSAPMAFAPGVNWTRIWIPVGAGLFIVALAGSAIAVPQLRMLHTFQALIYVAVILLARKNQPSAFGAGTTIAVAWNSLQLFITHLAQVGARMLWILVSTGQLRRPDTLMVFVGTIGHFVLIVGCVGAFRELRPGKKEWWQFVLGGVLVLAYFGVIVATMLPR